MFKRRDTKLLVENWRNFINESEENQSNIRKDEFIKLGLLQKRIIDGKNILELVPFRKFVKKVEKENIMAAAKSLIEDIISDKIKVDDMSRFYKFRDFVGIKEIKTFFYDEEFEKYIRENKSVIENTIKDINTEFTNQIQRNMLRNMLDFREKSIIPKLKETINTLLNDFKQNYAEALDVNNLEFKIKRMPSDLDRNFTKKCLRKFSFIANSNKEIHEDLQNSLYNVAQVGLEYK